MEKIFAEGIRFEKPREGSPEFVKGRISVKVADFIEWATKNKDERGWLNMDLLKSREKGTLYLALNTWKPKEKTAEQKDEEVEYEVDGVKVNAVDIPF